MATETRVAIDSCVFVNIVTMGEADPADWFKFSKRVVERGVLGQYRLVVPTLVLAEVAGSGEVRGDHLLPDVRAARVVRFRDWLQRSTALEVELDGHTARVAADLAIEYQLKGADASVLACALAARSQRLYTWDDGLLKIGAVDGLSIHTPSEAGADDLLEHVEDQSVSASVGD